MKIPNMTLWCPRTLIDVSQLNNYYNQLALEVAYRSGYVQSCVKHAQRF